jgi:hypothetical protein
MATETRAGDEDSSIQVLFDAVVRTPIAPMHAEPQVASQMISQQLSGHRVEVVDEEGDWVAARGTDGYEGWIHLGFLARAPHTSARQSRQSHRISLGCISRTASGDRRALPLRAILAPDEAVSSGDCLESSRLAERFPLDPPSIVRSAQTYFTSTSYLWGGVTPWGADCSGLVQSVFALHGLQLPRDAWQQSLVGTDAGRDVGELRAADLLFFSDRADKHPTHVGLALGEGRMVHLALGRGGYSVERLNDRKDVYVEKLRSRFLFGRRVV